MTSKAVGTYIVESKPVKTIRAHVLMAREIVEDLPNKPFYVPVASLSRRASTIPKHSKLAILTEHPTVLVNILDSSDTYL